MKSIRFALLTLLCLWVGSVYAQIAIYGDTRSNETTHRQVVQAIAAHKPKIAFHTISSFRYRSLLQTSAPSIPQKAIMNAQNPCFYLTSPL